MKWLALLIPLSLSAQTYTVDWTYPAPPCIWTLPSCEAIENTVCAEAVSSDSWILDGSQMSWSGAVVCPDRPFGRIETKGWTQSQQSSHRLVFGASVYQPIHIDSLRVEYRSDVSGPTMVRIGYEPVTFTGLPQELSTEEIPDTSVQSKTYYDLGCIPVEGQSGFLISIQPYAMGNSSRFFVNQVTVWASFCAGMGVAEYRRIILLERLPYNLLGQKISLRRQPLR